MPELPEVETVRRGLAPVLERARIVRLEQRRPDLRFPFPEMFARRVEGHELTALRRRAKYLLGDLDSGETLVMHLGMTGRFRIEHPACDEAARRGAKPGAFAHAHGDAAAHDHVAFEMSNGARITYNDARRFGFMLLVRTHELDAHPLFEGLGPEPLGNELSAAHLASRALGRKTDLKAFLLDQRTIAGLGNIYVAEALFRAGLSPKKRAGTLATRGGRAKPEAERLVVEIRAVLEAAIEAGGSTLRDYRHADGGMGYFQHAFQVYGRDGEGCPRAGCAGTVRRIVQAGRSTFFCPACQR